MVVQSLCKIVGDIDSDIWKIFQYYVCDAYISFITNIILIMNKRSSIDNKYTERYNLYDKMQEIMCNCVLK